MNKKAIILTEKQLNEISGLNFSYLDGIGKKSDIGDVYANETSAEGTTDDGYCDNLTTDDYSDTLSKDWPRDSRSYGRDGNAPANIREMSKKDWENRYILNEEKENGQHLSNIKFGNNDMQYSDKAMKQWQYRKRKAARQALNGSTPEEKLKGLQSLQRIENKGGKSRKVAEKQFDAAKASAKVLRKNIKSAPKINVGTSHDKNFQNGIITPTK